MLLALDLGTTNVKALVTDLGGEPIARGSSPVRLFHVADSGVEQDIEEIWRATRSAIHQALQKIDPGQVRAIGVSSQGGALQIVAPNGAPVGPVISWLDQRGIPFDTAANQNLGNGWFLERISHHGSWLGTGQILRLRHDDPQALTPPNRIGFVGDIVVSRLCGRPAHDSTSAGLTLLYNPRKRGYEDELLHYLGIRPEQLPDLISARIPAGGLLPGMATETGLKAGIPVSAAVHDQYASALATGAVHAGTVMLGTGTAWVLLAVTESLPIPVHNAFVCTHIIEGLYGQILSMVNGGSAVSWALELIGQSDVDGRAIDQLLQSCAPGSEHLVFWPFLTTFDPAGLAAGTRGRLYGLQLGHKPAHIVRAVVEGLCYETARHLDLLQSSGVPVNRLVMGGGAAASRVTPQILADVTGLTLECYGGNESSVFGAAIIARGLIEANMSLTQLALTMKPPGKKVRPGSTSEFYGKLYREYIASLPSQRNTPL